MPSQQNLFNLKPLQGGLKSLANSLKLIRSIFFEVSWICLQTAVEAFELPEKFQIEIVFTSIST
jgi:hypothetical protein